MIHEIWTEKQVVSWMNEMDLRNIRFLMDKNWAIKAKNRDARVSDVFDYLVLLSFIVSSREEK